MRFKVKIVEDNIGVYRYRYLGDWYNRPDIDSIKVVYKKYEPITKVIYK